MVMTKDDGIIPGLFPVLHTTLMVVADYAGQFTPSIIIEYLEMSVTNPVPVNMTVSPPYTWPNLGLIDVSKGVEEA